MANLDVKSIMIQQFDSLEKDLNIAVSELIKCNNDDDIVYWQDRIVFLKASMYQVVTFVNQIN